MNGRASKMFDVRLVLRDEEDVLAQRIETAVVVELPTAVIQLGSTRKALR